MALDGRPPRERHKTGRLSHAIFLVSSATKRYQFIPQIAFVVAGGFYLFLKHLLCTGNCREPPGDTKTRNSQHLP